MSTTAEAAAGQEEHASVPAPLPQVGRHCNTTTPAARSPSGTRCPGSSRWYQARLARHTVEPGCVAKRTGHRAQRRPGPARRRRAANHLVAIAVAQVRRQQFQKEPSTGDAMANRSASDRRGMPSDGHRHGQPRQVEQRSAASASRRRSNTTALAVLSMALDWPSTWSASPRSVMKLGEGDLDAGAGALNGTGTPPAALRSGFR